MSKFCRICHNTDCSNHGRDITFLGDGFKCNYIPVPTNADRIRAMTDEELAVFLSERYAKESVLRVRESGYEPTATEIKELTVRLYMTWLRWLKQPAEE